MALYNKNRKGEPKKKRRAIQVDSVDDPRYKAYQDSLNAYNYGVLSKDYIDKLSNYRDKNPTSLNKTSNDLSKLIKNETSNNDVSLLYKNKKIKPININRRRGVYGNDFDDNTYSLYTYKKPVQPVEVLQRVDRVEPRGLYSPNVRKLENLQERNTAFRQPKEREVSYTGQYGTIKIPEHYDKSLREQYPNTQDRINFLVDERRKSLKKK